MIGNQIISQLDIFFASFDLPMPSMSIMCGTVNAARPMKVIRRIVGPGSAKSANIQKATPAAIQLITVKIIA